jgi:hypothetical protein
MEHIVLPDRVRTVEESFIQCWRKDCQSHGNVTIIVDAQHEDAVADSTGEDLRCKPDDLPLGHYISPACVDSDSLLTS